MLGAFRVLASDRYLEKGMGLMALTGHRPAEIFFSAKFSLPRKKLPYPAVIFDGQLKTRNAPGTSFEPYPIRPGRPKKDHPCARSFAFPAAHHTSTASEFSLVLSTRSDSFKLRL